MNKVHTKFDWFLDTSSLFWHISHIPKIFPIIFNPHKYFRKSRWVAIEIDISWFSEFPSKLFHSLPSFELYSNNTVHWANTGNSSRIYKCPRILAVESWPQENIHLPPFITDWINLFFVILMLLCPAKTFMYPFSIRSTNFVQVEYGLRWGLHTIWFWKHSVNIRSIIS